MNHVHPCSITRLCGYKQGCTGFHFSKSGRSWTWPDFGTEIRPDPEPGPDLKISHKMFWISLCPTCNVSYCITQHESSHTLIHFCKKSIKNELKSPRNHSWTSQISAFQLKSNAHKSKIDAEWRMLQPKSNPANLTVKYAGTGFGQICLQRPHFGLARAGAEIRYIPSYKGYWFLMGAYGLCHQEFLIYCDKPKFSWYINFLCSKMYRCTVAFIVIRANVHSFVLWYCILGCNVPLDTV